MIDWDFWRWVGTTLVAIGALVLGLFNAARTWRYSAHWTVEKTAEGVRVFNRTGEDATDVSVAATRETGYRETRQFESYSEALVEADAAFEFETERWFEGGIDWNIYWRRPRTKRYYVQAFADPEQRKLWTRLKVAREAFRKKSVRGRRQPLPKV